MEWIGQKCAGIQYNMENGPQKVGSVDVVGAGIGGMQAALDMANSSFMVHLVSRDSSIGGIMAMLDKTFPTGEYQDSHNGRSY